MPNQPAFGAPDASIFWTGMPMGGNPLNGPGQGFKPSGPNPYEKPKVVEDPK